MSKIARVKLGALKELFEKIGMSPIQKRFVVGNSCCIVTALNKVDEAIDNDFYKIGLMCGWDNDTDELSGNVTKSVEFKLGFADGRAAWKEVTNG